MIIESGFKYRPLPAAPFLQHVYNDQNYCIHHTNSPGIYITFVQMPRAAHSCEINKTYPTRRVWSFRLPEFLYGFNMIARHPITNERTFVDKQRQINERKRAIASVFGVATTNFRLFAKNINVVLCIIFYCYFQYRKFYHTSRTLCNNFRMFFGGMSAQIAPLLC